MHFNAMVYGGKSTVVEGFIGERSTRKLLFSLPCLPRDSPLSDNRRRQLGTIRAQFSRVTKPEKIEPSQSARATELVQASKSDAAGAGRTTTVATTRLGNTLSEASPVLSCDYYERIAELCVDYKTTQEMQALGLIPSAPRAAHVEEAPSAPGAAVAVAAFEGHALPDSLMKEHGCGLEVLVGGQALREYSHGGRTIVEASLETPQSRETTEQRDTPHGPEVDPHWRVTPYQLRLSNDNPFDVGVRLWVDGERMHLNAVVYGGKTTVVEGFMGERSTRELLFSLPCFPRDSPLSDDRRRQLGTIRAEFWRVSKGEKMEPSQSARATELVQASKSDAAGTGRTTTVATTRLGNTLSEASPVFTHVYHERLAELCTDYKTTKEMQALGLIPSTPRAARVEEAPSAPGAAEAIAALEGHALPDPLVCSVVALLGSVRVVYGLDLFDRVDDIGRAALAADCKLLPRSALSGAQGALAVGLPRSAVERVPASSSAFVQSAAAAPCDTGALCAALGGAHVVDIDCAGEADGGLSRALAVALLLSERLHFVVETLWHPRGHHHQQREDTGSAAQRLQEVARAFGVRLSVVVGGSRWAFEPREALEGTRDVAVAWAGDRYVALMGSASVPLVRALKRPVPGAPPQNPLHSGEVIDLS
eukprot:m51a1_g8035 hypothetical protein (649) ;mRNA; f:42178-45288